MDLAVAQWDLLGHGGVIAAGHAPFKIAAINVCCPHVGDAANEQRDPAGEEKSLPLGAANPPRWRRVALIVMPAYALGMTCFLEACNQPKTPAVLRFPLERPVQALMNWALVL